MSQESKAEKDKNIVTEFLDHVSKNTEDFNFFIYEVSGKIISIDIFKKEGLK